VSDQDKQRIIDEQRQRHGKIVVLEAEATEWDDAIFVIVKRPPRSEFKRYRAMLFDDAQRPDAHETLTRACVVYPEGEAFMRILADQPALAQSIANKLIEAAGGDRELHVKKF
jgi:CTP:molybdopterin cytidylyltransferase MocA